ncbi:hypothetical protein JT26_07700 [Porphyromonas sp. COT-108 OH1349]|nr:hypothetical protein JT26_07700 [Porphyromonas sp. COT-108 OH1349]
MSLFEWDAVKRIYTFPLRREDKNCLAKRDRNFPGKKFDKCVILWNNTEIASQSQTIFVLLKRNTGFIRWIK